MYYFSGGVYQENDQENVHLLVITAIIDQNVENFNVSVQGHDHLIVLKSSIQEVVRNHIHLENERVLIVIAPIPEVQISADVDM